MFNFWIIPLLFKVWKWCIDWQYESITFAKYIMLGITWFAIQTVKLIRTELLKKKFENAYILTEMMWYYFEIRI